MALLGRDDFGQILVAGRGWWVYVPWHSRLGRLRRRVFERFGSTRYSRPALHGLDRTLERYLPERDGFFVEAGAHDGFVQSNTYYFERFKHWHGVLVEPIPELYARCMTERRHSAVFNCALVSSHYHGRTATMQYGDLFSLISGAQGSSEADEAHVRTGAPQNYSVTVPARTLSSVLDEAAAQQIDLLSLDVEGYEPEVLEGLDLDRHAPRYMLIEMLEPERTRGRIEALLGGRYEVLSEPSPHDVLYRRRDDWATETTNE